LTLPIQHFSPNSKQDSTISKQKIFVQEENYS